MRSVMVGATVCFSIVRELSRDFFGECVDVPEMRLTLAIDAEVSTSIVEMNCDQISNAFLMFFSLLLFVGTHGC